MTDIEVLQRLIKEEAKVVKAIEYDRIRVVLEESKASDSTVAVRGLPEESIVIKADAFKSPDSVFNCSKGECKRADFVIVADTGKTRAVVYIEMKSRKASLEEVRQQLKGAQCFVSYCSVVAKAFYGRKDLLKDYNQRFVSIGHTGIRKKRTRIDRVESRHDSPDRLLKIDWPGNIEFKKLIGETRS